MGGGESGGGGGESWGTGRGYSGKKLKILDKGFFHRDEVDPTKGELMSHSKYETGTPQAGFYTRIGTP